MADVFVAVHFHQHRRFWPPHGHFVLCLPGQLYPIEQSWPYVLLHRKHLSAASGPAICPY